MDLLNLPEFDSAIEIVPGRWVDDDEIMELERHYRHRQLRFERFADGTLLVTPALEPIDIARKLALATQIAAWIAADVE
ncbi:MAG TPA: hypothetical protein VFF00_02140 [Candidatus Elarobacter sp.]|nr:hypothetical protein [Dongiaceae bacterium]HZW52801.1 hypothetical protein [Candidatus Elarobacter sp.]